MSSTKIKINQTNQSNQASPKAQMQIDRGHSLSVVLYISLPIHFQSLF